MSERNLSEMIDKLQRGPSTLLILNDESVVFSSSDGGLAPLVNYIEQLPHLPASGNIAVDKVVGGAAARLFSYAGVKTIFTPVASEAAVEICDKEDLHLKYQSAVEAILNPQTGEPCRLEKLSTKLDSSEDFYLRARGRVTT